MNHCGLHPGDGGAANAEVTYMAAEGATVTLTGASVLCLQWEAWKGPVSRAKVDSTGAIDQLFVNGECLMMARYHVFHLHPPRRSHGFYPCSSVALLPIPKGAIEARCICWRWVDDFDPVGRCIRNGFEQRPIRVGE